MIKKIIRTAVSILIIFVIGFTAGMALNKYHKSQTGLDSQFNTYAIGKTYYNL